MHYAENLLIVGVENLSLAGVSERLPWRSFAVDLNLEISCGENQSENRYLTCLYTIHRYLWDFSYASGNR